LRQKIVAWERFRHQSNVASRCATVFSTPFI